MKSFLCLSIALVAAFCGAYLAADVTELREKWEQIAENRGYVEFEKKAAEEAAANGLIVPPGEVNSNAPTVTNTLVAWVSSQCESIVEEMEAIARQNAETNRLSIVNYLRYLHLYDKLKIIGRQPYLQLKWVHLKSKIFGSIYQDTLDVLSAHLEDVNAQLLKVELAEPKGKQVGPSKKWIELFEIIRYIATHAPKDSSLSKRAIELMQQSPNNQPDKERSMRYQLKTSAFSK